MVKVKASRPQLLILERLTGLQPNSLDVAVREKLNANLEQIDSLNGGKKTRKIPKQMQADLEDQGTTGFSHTIRCFFKKVDSGKAHS